uniref:Pre-mRNA splicing factor component Cdc5p/Cef1 C-terminal domain-containing protein n=1 Tax=Romanomermis culicivorax TaxID=13658 RepID=A0A915L6Y1_ROMCU
MRFPAVDSLKTKALDFDEILPILKEEVDDFKLRIVKVGRASEAARETAECTGDETGASSDLLFDYSLSSQNDVNAGLRTPRTPAASKNIVMQEAQNLLALHNVETPLKGGLNTPLVESDFSGITPRREVVQTPNTLLATPSTQRKDGQTPGRFTPASTPGSVTQTSLRNALKINAPDEETNENQSIKRVLSKLPKPKNDFEIVVPDEEPSEVADQSTNADDHHWPEDASDIEAKKLQMLRKEMEDEWRKQTQSVQRDLPRPGSINDNILRPQYSSDLHEAEEMIKREMLILLHHDAIYNPINQVQKSNKKDKKENSAIADEKRHLQYLSSNKYEDIDELSLEQAREILNAETERVKSAFGHGEIKPHVFTKVWEECYSQVLFMPSQKKYVRQSSAVTKKDRIESLEFKLNTNKAHMMKEAKKAAKREKNLKILLHGYQSRAQTLTKLIQERYDQLEVAHVERSTFSFLRDQETFAIPKRVQALEDDVKRQEKRENDLQKHYYDLKLLEEELKELEKRENASITSKPVRYAE